MTDATEDNKVAERHCHLLASATTYNQWANDQVVAEGVAMEDVQLVHGMRMGLRCHARKILQQWKLWHLVRHCDDDVIDRRERLKRLSQELNRPRLMLKAENGGGEGEAKERETLK
jgi:hypothetical protein